MSGIPGGVKVVQDMPPPGGFADFEIFRHFPKRGPNGLTLFLLGGATVLLGLYWVGEGNKIERVRAAEKRFAKLSILPMLVAESDRNYVRRKIEIDSQEAEIMKDVPGWEVGKSPYKTRWSRPVIS